MKTCYACGAVWEEKHEPGRQETCLKCGTPLHCCLNCRHYDPMKARQCASMTTDPPSDKGAANDCDEFQMADGERIKMSSEQRRRAVEQKWKNLFKD